jgi:hypothetical protein
VFLGKDLDFATLKSDSANASRLLRWLGRIPDVALSKQQKPHQRPVCCRRFHDGFGGVCWNHLCHLDGEIRDKEH